MPKSCGQPSSRAFLNVLVDSDRTMASGREFHAFAPLKENAALRLTFLNFLSCNLKGWPLKFPAFGGSKSSCGSISSRPLNMLKAVIKSPLSLLLVREKRFRAFKRSQYGRPQSPFTIRVASLCSFSTLSTSDWRYGEAAWIPYSRIGRTRATYSGLKISGVRSANPLLIWKSKALARDTAFRQWSVVLYVSENRRPRSVGLAAVDNVLPLLKISGLVRGCTIFM